MKGRYFYTAILHTVVVALLCRIIFWITPTFIANYYFLVLNVLVVLLISALTFEITRYRYLSDKVPTHNKAVLITGCDSGFGHFLAKRLDSKGFHVFASCLCPNGDGATALRKGCSARLRVLELNVTKDESVKAALQFVNNNLKGTEFWAVVNNAGVYKGISAELTGMDEFRETMDVNGFGPVRVTKAFLPLLRKSKGRVVNLTSFAGRMPSPFMAAYFMSKHATVGFNDSLRQEVDVWGVKVISVEPEVFRTPMTSKELLYKGIDYTLSTLDDEVRRDYGEEYIRSIWKVADLTIRCLSPKVDLVVDDLEAAVSSKYPQINYKTRRNFFTRFCMIFYETMPSYFQDICVRVIVFLIRFAKPKAMVFLAS